MVVLSSIMERRLCVLHRLVAKSLRCNATSSVIQGNDGDKSSISIGHVTKPVQSARNFTTSPKNFSKFSLAKKYHGLEKNVWYVTVIIKSLNSLKCLYFLMVFRVEFVKIALEYQPLNLGQGLPDDLVPNYVIDSLSEVLKDPNASLQQYTRGFGHPRLINAIASLYTHFLNRSNSIDSQTEVLVTDGAYEALFCAIMGNVNPGDEVIIIEPYFDCYEPMVRLAGGIPKFIALAPHGKNPGEPMTSADWTLDIKELSALFNDKTKAIIFNNPNNPLGGYKSYFFSSL